MMNTAFSFIVIDDSELDCFLVQKILKHTDKGLSIKAFQDAQLALEMIRENPNDNSLIPTIILLDLQMPLMDGFKFADEFEKLPAEVKKNYKIIILTILSATRNANELYTILNYPTVHGIIEKPITTERLILLLMQVRPHV